MDIVALWFNVEALTLFKSVLSLLISYWRQAFSRDYFVPKLCMFDAAAAVVISRTSCMYLSLASSSSCFKCILYASAILSTNESTQIELEASFQKFLFENCYNFRSQMCLLTYISCSLSISFWRLFSLIYSSSHYFWVS